MLKGLEVATPERVALELPVAGVGYRCLAYMVDLCVIFAGWVTLYFIYSLFEVEVVQRLQGLSGVGWTLVILGVFATQWIYWTASEVAMRGQTIGKRALGIRVVRWDGSPVGFFESAIRNLCRAVDFLPALYACGVLTMLITQRHLRLGDLLAGTVLVREDKANLDRYAALDVAPGTVSLGTAETELVLEFLSRAPSLDVERRRELGSDLWKRFSRGLSPQAREAGLASVEVTEEALRSLLRKEAS